MLEATVPEVITKRPLDGLLDDADLAAIDKDVWKEIDSAVAEAENSAWEPAEDLTKDVYTRRQP